MKKPSSRGQKGKKTPRRSDTAPVASPPSKQQPSKDTGEVKESCLQGTSQEANPPPQLYDWWWIKDQEKAFALKESKEVEKDFRIFTKKFPSELKETIERLTLHGYQEEVEELSAVIKQYNRSEKPEDARQDKEFYKLWVQFASVFALDAYLKGGNQAALVWLPLLLDYDCTFFLKPLWIRRLIASWREKGEEKKIRRLFFGTPHKGRRSLKTIKENEPRNQKIYIEVQKLLKSGCKYDKAMEHVSKDLKTLGIKDQLSPSAVQKIYTQRKSGYTPLRALLQVMPKPISSA